MQVEEGGLNIWTHTMCSVQCAVCSVQYMVYSVHGSVCSVQCTVCSVWCAHLVQSDTTASPTVKQEQTTLCVQALAACSIWSRPGLGLDLCKILAVNFLFKNYKKKKKLNYIYPQKRYTKQLISNRVCVETLNLKYREKGVGIDSFLFFICPVLIQTYNYVHAL